MPLFIKANRYDVMEKALDWAQEQGFERIVLMANPDVQYLAERLAADDIPVILRNVYAMPSRRWEPYDMAFVAAARLAEAGVRFAIADSGGGMDCGQCAQPAVSCRQRGRSRPGQDGCAEERHPVAG